MSRVDLHSALQECVRCGIVGNRRLRSLLVGGEIALATLLLITALLVTQTLWNLSRVPLG